MRDDPASLRGEIDRLLGIANSLYTRLHAFLDEVVPNTGKTDYAASHVAQLLESSYTALETLFLRISQAFENSLDPRKWHADLLDRMVIHVPQVRERVLSENSRSLLLELLRFRHFKRYYLELDYDWHRLDFLVGVLDRAMPLLKADIERFKDFLQRLTAD
jgi:hypothetical protein